MKYSELKDQNNFYEVGCGDKTVYFDSYMDAIEYARMHNYPWWTSVWTDEFGYMHSNYHYL